MFNSREIATGIWMLLLAIWALYSPDVRRSFRHLIAAFIDCKILLSISLMLAYVGIVVALLYKIGFWQINLAKDTVIWICFSGFVMAMEYATSRNNQPVFRTILVDNLRAIILIEFLLNTYTMPLIVELIFVPFVTLLVMLDAFAKNNFEQQKTRFISNIILSIICFSFFGYAVWSAYGDFKNLSTFTTLRSIAFPPVMSLLFSPFIFFVVVFVRYENLFLRLRIGSEKSRELVRYAKQRIFLSHGFNLRSLHDFSVKHALDLMRVQTNEDIDQLLKST